MVGTSKILTVSYGTFSCTLEGFDDPFSTMRSIAEYFRDLAADDRYFGAEPPTPDAEMLHRIAEREIQRRVEAQVEDNGVVLRQVTGEPTQQSDEAATETVPAPRSETVAERLDRLRSAVATGAAATAAGVAAGASVGDAEPAEDDGALADTTDNVEATELPAYDDVPDDLLAAEDLEAADAFAFAGDDEDEAKSLVEGDSGDSTFDLSEAAPGHESEDDAVAEEVAAEFAPLSNLDEDDEPFDATYSAAPETHPEDGDEPIAIAEDAGAETDETDEEHAFGLESASGEFEAEEDLILDEPIGVGPQEAEDDRVVPITRPLPKTKILHENNDMSAETSLSEEDEAELLMELSAIGDDDDISSDTNEDEDTAFGDWGEDLIDEETHEDEEPAEADAAPLRLDAALAADPEEPAVPAEEEVEDLAEEEILGFGQDDSDLSTEADDTEDDKDPSLDAAIAGAIASHDDRSNLDEQPAPATPEDPAFDRILEETNSKMDDSEGSRRRSAIAHLKAAVAATKADRLLKQGDGQDAEDAAQQSRYRDDLAQVVRPSRPVTEPKRPDPVEDQARQDAGDGSSLSREDADTAEEAQPLMLVSELRVAEDQGAEEEPPHDALSDNPIRPRRVISARLAPVANTGEDIPTFEDDDDGENLFEPDESFAEFAEKMGATELPDLLEAAAAYAAFVEGRKHFSRPQLMKRVASYETNEEFTREAGLRSFGQLLRQGKIQKLKRGQFTITEDTRFNPGARIAGE